MDKNTIIELIFRKYLQESKPKVIFLTGSSRNLEFDIGKDIDVFIIDDKTKKQFREIKVIEGFEFDINILSENLVNNLIDKNEKFMIKAIYESNFIWGDYVFYKNLRSKIINSL